ncbi:MAG TPA: hypothetical protein VHQ86_00350 [Candidatus Saccharimonadia bacterium]|jgi:hypothetical protein|nr:hypothetical protein [Candidatus Saccharimonadia bacterium]
MKLERVGFIAAAVLVLSLMVSAMATPFVATAAPAPAATCVKDLSGKCPTDPLKGSGGAVCIAIPIVGGASGGGSCPAGQYEVPNDPASGGAIVFYLKWVLKFLSALIGVIIILMIVISGIQYMTSAGNSSRISGAKTRLVSAFIALVLFMFMFAILNFLIPGGILS